MIIKYTAYKNSVLATILSLLGSLSAGGGMLILVSAIFVRDSELDLGPAFIGFLVLFLLGVALMWAAKCTSERKQSRALIKAIKKNGLEEQIFNSVEVALSVYKRYPTKRMKKYISALNPQAGQIIQMSK